MRIVWLALLTLFAAPSAYAQDSIIARGATAPPAPPPPNESPSPAPAPQASPAPTSPGAPGPPAVPTAPARRGAVAQPALRDSTRTTAAASADRHTAVPVFGIGERADYDVKFGIVHVGGGDMEVADTETVRGQTVWHTVFHIHGGTFFYHVNDVLESWFTIQSLASLRFVQHLDEGGAKRDRVYEMYPDRQVYVQNGKPEQPSVSAPLDDGSFIYFVRTIPLEVGQTYNFDRYFNPKSNPVTIRVLRREKVTVPAGTFDAIVVQPIIKTAGIFSQKGEAQIWIADDSTRAMLQMKSKLSFGSIDLYLRSFHPSAERAPLAAPSVVPSPSSP
jgi:hypothetical protein